jgi:restriction endonuclease S subunit
VKLKDVLTEYQNFIQIDNEKRYKQLTVSNTGEVKLRDIVKGEEIATKRQNEIIDDGSEYLIYSRLGLHTGSIGFIPFGLIDSIVSTDFPVFKSTENVKYLAYILQSKIFINKIIEKNPTGAAQQRFHQDDFLELEIPLPTLDEQNAIIAQIEKQTGIINGADIVCQNWQMLESDFIKDGVNYNHFIIDDFASVGTGSTPSREIDEYFTGENNWVLTSEVAMNEITSTSEKLSDSAIKDYGLKIYPENTILIAMYGQGKTRGQSALLKIPASITQNCGAIVLDQEKALPKYVWYFLMSIYEKIRGQDYSGGGVPHLNLTIVKQIRVPLPDLAIQEQIVNELEEKINIIQGLRKMKAEAQKKINQILADVWGVEFVESENILVEDEQEN